MTAIFNDLCFALKKTGQMYLVAPPDLLKILFHFSYYESYCGMVNGSFGSVTLTLDYIGEVTNQDVSSYRFAGTDRLFANATDNPDNWCFCSGNPSGVANFSTCRFDMPIFVSFPHYYLADPYYADQVQGLNPQQELHLSSDRVPHRS